mmetsp:Transcript_15400/g.60190  ORF Transcript_15400/g.60190 Transcript_15400/m.60190 type:complete len:615 (+) Transcript_15400:196-2040(+)
MTPVCSIEDVLSRAPACSNFLGFLQQNYQGEYLEFWLLAEKYKHTEDLAERKVLGSKVFELYFNDASARCLAIDRAFTEGLEHAVGLARPELFVKAQRAAYIQLRQSFTEYLNSDLYRAFLAGAGGRKGSDDKHRKSLKDRVKRKKSPSLSPSPSNEPFDFQSLIDEQSTRGVTAPLKSSGPPKSLAGSQGLTVGFLSLITAEEETATKDVAAPTGFLTFTTRANSLDPDMSPSVDKKRKKPKKKERRKPSQADGHEERELRKAFREVFLAPGFLLSTQLLKIAISEDEGAVEPLGEAIVDLFLVNDKMVELLEVVFKAEFATYKGAKQDTVLLRTDSAATTLMSKYLAKRAGKHLSKIVQPILERILQHPDGLEVDPCKNPDADHAANSNTILLLVQDLLDSIVASISTLPWDVLKVLAVICKMAEEAFSEDIGYQVIGSILFLRFICPALVTPLRYGIILGNGEPMSIACRRAAVLVSKLLQNLVNGVEADGTKEAYMTTLNGFLGTKNQNKLREFYKSIVSVPDDSEAQANVLLHVRRQESLSSTEMKFLRQYLVDHLDGVWMIAVQNKELAKKFFPFIKAGLALSNPRPRASSTSATLTVDSGHNGRRRT